MRLNVNGKDHTVDAPPETKLLEVLRDDLGLTGAKYGCGEAQCGACTVLLDGQPVRSCMVPVSAAEPAKIRTIEGLEQDGKLHPLQQAFLDEDAMQCGFCSTGMIMEAVALLERNPDPTETQIAQGMQGHVCRCGVYPRIVAAARC
jgi:aerobic-type carbon monoxide dehydrogenase small subunit (CoxS/CutS family)